MDANDILKKYGFGESVGVKPKKKKPNYSSIYAKEVHKRGVTLAGENMKFKSAINEIIDYKLKKPLK